MKRMQGLLPRGLCLVASSVVCALACGLAQAGDDQGASARSPQVAAGKQVYEAWCVWCHGPGPGRYGTGLTGTAALEAKYNGKLPAVLDERRDLTPEVVRAYVRKGVSVMPFFRKTEITDQELDALAAYLSRLNSAAAHKP